MDDTMQKAADQMATLLEEAGARGDGATPCADWSVNQLVSHVVGGAENFALMASGEEPDWSAEPSVGPDPAGRFRGHVSDLRDALARDDSASPGGMLLAEWGVHTYDLATAVGQDTSALDPAVAERGLEFMRDNLRPDLRGDAFGPEQPAPEGADAYQRLAAFAGRAI